MNRRLAPRERPGGKRHEGARLHWRAPRRLTVAFLLGGCTAGASTTPRQASASPAASPAAAATPTPAARATAAPTRDAAYQSGNPVLVPGLLDVFAPAEARPWPVVVMFPPPGDDATALTPEAGRVAGLGFVVFVPSFGQGWSAAAPSYAGVLAGNSQAACAVAYARGRQHEGRDDLGAVIDAAVGHLGDAFGG